MRILLMLGIVVSSNLLEKIYNDKMYKIGFMIFSMYAVFTSLMPSLSPDFNPHEYCAIQPMEMMFSMIIIQNLCVFQFRGILILTFYEMFSFFVMYGLRGMIKHEILIFILSFNAINLIKAHNYLSRRFIFYNTIQEIAFKQQ